MSFGKRLSEARKAKGLSQEELAAMLGTKGPAIGRYERDEMKPSIEVAARISNILEISLDYMVGKTDVEVDKDIMARVLSLSKFSEADRLHIFAVMDAFIAKAKVDHILS